MIVLASVTLLFVLSACQVPLPVLPTLTPVQQAAVPTDTPTIAPTDTPTPVPTDTPTPTPEPTATPTSTPVPTKKPVSKSAPAKVSTPTPAVYVMKMTEAELNKLAQEEIAKQSDVAVSNVRIDLQPDQIVVSGTTKVGFFNVNLEITAIIPVKNGRPEPEITEIKVNGEPVTGFLRQQIDAMIAPYLNQFAQTDLGVYVDDVTITNDQFVITGRSK